MHSLNEYVLELSGLNLLPDIGSVKQVLLPSSMRSSALCDIAESCYNLFTDS